LTRAGRPQAVLSGVGSMPALHHNVSCDDLVISFIGYGLTAWLAPLLVQHSVALTIEPWRRPP
jgi:hypothetical protein